MRARSVILSSILLFFGCGGEDAPPEEFEEIAAEVCKKDNDCSDDAYCNGTEKCDPEDADADAQGCVAGLDRCLSGQACHEKDRSCITECDVTRDADHDGSDAVECGGDDCDDSRDDRAPFHQEICDSADLDEDCDPKTFGFRDQDGDEFVDASCCNHDDSGSNCGNDCDDTRKSIHPTANETCDELDNDCDGKIDNVTEEGTVLFEDADMDGFGDINKPILACRTGDGVSDKSNDCDDSRGDVNPSQDDDNCDGIDNDCDGQVDEGGKKDPPVWFVDADGDGYGDLSLPSVVECVPEKEGYTMRTPPDCDDTHPDVYPGAPDLCDKLINSCPLGETGEEPDEDFDNDGQASIDDTCEGGLPKTDCDDGNELRGKGFAEICDGIDNNCRYAVDEGCPITREVGAHSTTVLAGEDTGTETIDLCPGKKVATSLLTGYWDDSFPQSLTSGGLGLVCKDFSVDSNDLALTLSEPVTVSGGGSSQQRDCDEGSFLVGVRLFFVENYIHATQALCEKYAWDVPTRSLVAQSESGLASDRNSSGDESVLRCPAGEIVVGTHFHLGKYNGSEGDGMRLECARPEVKLQPKLLLLDGEVQKTALAGKSVDEPDLVELNCPVGMALSGIVGNSGSSVGLRCAALGVIDRGALWDSAIGPEQNGPFYGTPFGTDSCPKGRVMTGFRAEISVSYLHGGTPLFSTCGEYQGFRRVSGSPHRLPLPSIGRRLD